MKFTTTFDEFEHLSIEEKLSLPLSDGDAKLFNDDGSPNYRGRVALDNNEKARVCGFELLVDDVGPVANPCSERIERFRAAMRMEHQERVARVANLMKDDK